MPNWPQAPVSTGLVTTYFIAFINAAAAFSATSAQQFHQLGESMPHGGGAHLSAVAVKVALFGDDLARHGEAEPDRADRLGRAAAGWAGHAGHGDRHLRVRVRQG